MDWDKVDLQPESDRKSVRADLSLLDYVKLRVVSKLLRKSIQSTVQTAIYTYLQRNWKDYEDRLTVEAKTLGLTPEEYFSELAKPDVTKDYRNREDK